MITKTFNIVVIGWNMSFFAENVNVIMIYRENREIVLNI